MPASGGPSSCASHLARDTRVQLAASAVAWISETTRPRARRRARAAAARGSGTPRATGPGLRTSRSTRSASTTASRTLCVTNRNVLRPSELDPYALDLVLEQLARLRVERAERLVAEQHGGVGRQRTGERRALTHARRELVRLRIGPPLEVDVGEPAVGALAPFLGRDSGRTGGPVRRCREPTATGTGPVPGTARRGLGPGLRSVVRRARPARCSAPPGRRARSGPRSCRCRSGPSRQTNSPGCTSNETSARGRRSRSPLGRAAVHGEVADAELGISPRVRRDASRVAFAHRNRNFSAISIWTTLPSCTTRTTVPKLMPPQDLRRRAPGRPAPLSLRSSSSRSSRAAGSGRIAHRADATPPGRWAAWHPQVLRPSDGEGRDADIRRRGLQSTGQLLAARYSEAPTGQGQPPRSEAPKPMPRTGWLTPGPPVR